MDNLTTEIRDPERLREPTSALCTIGLSLSIGVGIGSLGGAGGGPPGPPANVMTTIAGDPMTGIAGISNYLVTTT